MLVTRPLIARVVDDIPLRARASDEYIQVAEGGRATNCDVSRSGSRVSLDHGEPHTSGDLVMVDEVSG